jgi:hypothetical protein
MSAILEAGAQMAGVRVNTDQQGRFLGASVFRNRVTGDYVIRSFAGYAMRKGQTGEGAEFIGPPIPGFLFERSANVINSRRGFTMGLRRDMGSGRLLPFPADLYQSDGLNVTLLAEGGTTRRCARFSEE